LFSDNSYRFTLNVVGIGNPIQVNPGATQIFLDHLREDMSADVESLGISFQQYILVVEAQDGIPFPGY